mgnify:CR=1 FL=1|mmetsp:Transcript_71735/g.140918  ORF Transcript_71735/g.140918 Transcript_71735/m.140918 type:complete len:134 (-) Transcript_71735:21-422(-)|eukprot:CAMPEP_0170371934 /NCGR_PEP_ID=MMETSP0117_2-20130122/9291_1 /TAXON_ID=400756 /ORGANISM="Durinskia baltica, Strain CSIRO CS-38" /LENGTH=133 /DNA_ID=CAMNT_0010626773 /DNA_START=69 /DNA_END=470 /DNA_ORIENTATION=+
MPHTTTKVQRIKRVDTRPNEKVRRRLQKEIEDKKTIQNLRITSVQKNEKKERVAQLTPLTTLSKEEKTLRALRKKLNAINELLEREQNGDELDEQQQQKISTLPHVMKEMEDIMTKDSGGKRKRKASEDSSSD